MARAGSFTLNHIPLDRLGAAAPTRPHRRLNQGRAPVRLREIALVGACIVMGTLAIASALVPPARSPAAASPSLPQPSWVEIDRPLQLFALGGSPLAHLPMTYAARRKTVGIARQDLLTFGTFGGDAPFLRFAITRLDAGAAADADLVVEVARIAATAGLGLMRAGLPTTLPTRFGSVEVSDIALHGTETVPCLGFRLDGDAGPIAMAGIACGTVARPVERSTLACVIDHIDLVSAGDDDALRTVFVDAERRRTGACAGLRASRNAGLPE